MKKTLTVVPAYGRDYKNQKAVLLDWNSGKDFVIQDIVFGYDGAMINKQDAERLGIVVHIRYDGLRKIIVVKSKKKKQVESVVSVSVRLIIHSNKDIDINEIINEMDYDFVSKTKGTKIIDSNIRDFEIIE